MRRLNSELPSKILDIKGPKDLMTNKFCNDEGDGRTVTYCEYFFYHPDCPKTCYYAKQRGLKIK